MDVLKFSPDKKLDYYNTSGNIFTWNITNSPTAITVNLVWKRSKGPKQLAHHMWQKQLFNPQLKQKHPQTTTRFTIQHFNSDTCIPSQKLALLPERVVHEDYDGHPIPTITKLQKPITIKGIAYDAKVEVVKKDLTQQL